MQPTDHQLLRQYAENGSERAFGQLVERHTGMVFAICFQKLKDVQLAEDATQRVFLELSKRRNLPGEGALDGYLARIAFAVASTISRDRASRQRREREAMKFKPKCYQPYTPDPRLTAIGELLDGLSETLRDAIMLRYMQGMKTDAMAVALGVPEATVRKRLVRALDRLRGLMEEKGYDVSLAVAAGMVGLFDKPVPRPDLAASIAANILSSKATAPASPSSPRPRYVPKVAIGLGSAATVGALVAVTVLPKLITSRTASPPPSAVSGAFATTPTTRPLQGMTFQEKLKRRVPGITTQPIPLDFALKTLQDLSGVPMQPQWDAIEASGIGRHKHVTATVLNSNVIAELDAVLKSASPQGDLEYVIAEDKGVIIIRPKTSAHARLDGQ